MKQEEFEALGAVVRTILGTLSPWNSAVMRERMLVHYVAVGITREEFLLVMQMCHLERADFDILATRMGCDANHIAELFAGLERRGLARRYEEDGQKLLNIDAFYGVMWARSLKQYDAEQEALDGDKQV